jgi:hypothetical protein
MPARDQVSPNLETYTKMLFILFVHNYLSKTSNLSFFSVKLIRNFCIDS